MKKAVFMFSLTALLAVSAFSQSTVTLDRGLAGSVTHFKERVPKGTKLAILNIKSPYPRLSEYILEELTVYFVNSDHFTMVDRKNLELIQQEMNLQLSGEISDETIQSIGKKLGAQSIVSGSIESLGDIYRLRLQIISVESAVVQAAAPAQNIQRDRILTSLTNDSDSGGNNSQNSNSQSSQSGNSASSQNQENGGNRSRVALPDYLLN